MYNFYHSSGILSLLRWEAHSVQMKSLCLSLSPTSTLNIHQFSPFKAFPNNMTTFSCALSETSAWSAPSPWAPYSTSREPGWDSCWKLAGASAASLALTVFCVRHSRLDPTLWAVLMTSSITRTRSETLWCDREERNIINKDNEADGCS